MDRANPAPRLDGDRFDVRGTLGSGGAGVVYRAFDRQLGREVALKLLKHASGRDLYRFKREFRALADIAHPNLVALHELHAAAGAWFFTMELVEGVSFIDWTRPGAQRGPQRSRADIHAARLEVERLRGALVQLVDALVALHEAGKLHRDLKPSNVLVTASGRVTLLDFGLVTTLAESNPDRLAVGTPVYMSPEQASDQTLCEASDWYSLGAMLYEALTGRRPFEGDAQQVMTRKQTELPPHPGRVPADLAELCMALLQPRASRRPRGVAILDQLGAAPSPTTKRLARHHPSSTFVGRGRELAVLRDALADARRGGVALVVRGKSGIGKSTLVRKFLRGLHDGSDTVFVIEGRCFEREAVPFKMLDGVVDSLAAAIASLPDPGSLVVPELPALVRMFPVLRRVDAFAALAAQPAHLPADPSELRRRGFRGLRGLLGKLARLRPVVIFVDDAHWGDADSAQLLAELMHAPDRGMLVLVAHRPEDYLGVVAQLMRPPGGVARRGDIRELEIGALEPGDAVTLVEQLASEPGRAAIAVAAAAGNPLLLAEMARAPVLDARATIELLVRERAAKLGVDAQAMLVVSSIAARPLPVAIAAHAAGAVRGHDAAAALSAERLATLRQVDGEMILHPAHDHVRAAVLAGLDAEAKAGFHEALARAFEAVQGEAQLDSEAVVEHWLAAGHPANAAHHAIAAAPRAEEALAFRRAAELYEIALAFGPWDAAGQRDLLRRKAQALVCAGQLDEAAQIYEHAAQLLPDPEAIDLERLRVQALLRRGRLDEALPAAEKLLAQIGIRVPLGGRASRTRLATQWMQAKLRGHDYVERDATEVPRADLLAIDVLYSIASGLAFTDPSLGRVVQGELMRATLDAGEPMRVCLALALEICYAAGAGSRNRQVIEALSTRLLAIALRVGRPEVTGFAHAAIGIAAHMSGRWRDARGHLESGLATLRDHATGVRWELDLGDAYWLATLFYLGEWREMTRATQMLLRDAIDRADVVAQTNLRIGRCNFAWLLLDRPDEAREQLAIAARASASPEGEGAVAHLGHISAITAAANIDLYAGAPAAAARRLADAWPQLERLGCFRRQHHRIELALLDARVLLARQDRTDDHLRRVRARGDELIKEGTGWGTGLGHLVRAAASAWGGADDAARDELLAAEQHLVATGMLGFLHVARLRRGRIEGGAIGLARSAAARDFLNELGAHDADAIARLLVPWPPG